jgi:pimeloyl-ACP methyl ester carboxylesterase
LKQQGKNSQISVLIHSPLVGPLTWSRVAAEMRKRGFDVFVPSLRDSPASKEPFWKQHARSVSEDLAQLPKDTFVTLVAHSGAGPLLPAIRQSIPNRVHAYVFVDAGIPRDGASRLDLMKSEDPEWAAQFREGLEDGELFPTWSMNDLQEVILDESLRRQMVAELRPRGLEFFTEPLPVFDGWPDAPCVYVHFSAPYNRPAAQAREAGWPTYEMEAGHFHMLVDAKAVSDLIINAVSKPL